MMIGGAIVNAFASNFLNNHYDQRLKILVSRNVLHENYVTRRSLLSHQGARFLSGESMTLESKRNMFKAI